MKTSHVALIGLAAMHLTCHQVLFTAPPGSSIDLIANPGFIPANTGISVITAILFDPTGSPVADGTVVQFFTDLGRIDEQGRTNDGVARVNLYADSRSGLATVTAFSGQGGSGGTPPTTTPSSTTPPTTTLTTSRGVRAQGLAAVAAGNQVTVTIGSDNPASIILTANPQRITNPRYTTIAANVFDGHGNPVANVPVFFNVELPGSGGLEESLDSAGSPRFTDNNGRAVDILRTSYDPDAAPKTVSVVATIPGFGSSSPVQVLIN